MRHRSRKIVAALTVMTAMVGSRPSRAQMTPRIEKRTAVVHGAGYFPVLIRLRTGRLLVVYRSNATALPTSRSPITATANLQRCLHTFIGAQRTASMSDIAPNFPRSAQLEW